MNNEINTKNLFSLETKYLKKIFSTFNYPWEIIPKINEIINDFISKGIPGFYFLKKGVLIGGNVSIADNVVINSPAIIGANTEIRTGAYIRGNVIVGENCVLGNSCEYKNCILLNNVQTPHYNYIGDSILGNNVHLGAGVICSNLKSDKTNVVIKSDKAYKTGLRKLGAIIADDVEIGCGCVLNPGTIVGKKTTIYPLLSLRGIYPANSIVKSIEKIVLRKEK